MRLLWSWLVGFSGFWYHFVVGDDWTLAAAVALGLVMTYALNVSRFPAWWIVPALVIVTLGISVRRASKA
jgi:hypothetical protein